jgi:hypothetical protein
MAELLFTAKLGDRLLEKKCFMILFKDNYNDLSCSIDTTKPKH